MQTISGDLTDDHEFFENVDSLCWLPTEYFEEGDHNYDLINFKTEPGDDSTSPLEINIYRHLLMQSPMQRALIRNLQEPCFLRFIQIAC